MFKNYCTNENLLLFYPILSQYRKSTAENLYIFNIELSMAYKKVCTDLRNTNIDLKRIYVPLMLKDDVEHYETWTESANATGSNYTGRRENKLVVECTSCSGDTSLTLEGVNDTDKTWKFICSIDFNSTGIYTKDFDERWFYYRYKSIGTSSRTYSIYVVDASADQLIYMRTAMDIIMPLIGKGDIEKVYNELKGDYSDLLSALKLDYDIDLSGTIDSGEEQRKRTIRIQR